MRVLFLTGDFKGGRVGSAGAPRVEHPAAELSKLGYEVLATPHFAVNHFTGEIAGRFVDNTKVTGFDIVVMQRPMKEVHASYIEGARAAGQVVLNDVDDWFFGLPQTNAAFRISHEKLNPVHNRANYRRSLQSSDGLLCSTPYLQERMGDVHQRTWLCRNGVRTSDFEQHTQREVPVLGWVGNPSFRASDLQTLKGVVGPFLTKHDLTFHQVGHLPNTPVAGQLIDIPAENFSWQWAVKHWELPEALHSFDIGVVPLDPCPFNYSKSCLKGMEYAAAGLPFVAQETPEYLWLHDEHGIGRIARKPSDWIKHLTELLDPDVRQAEGERNRERIKALDTSRTVEGWVACFADVAVTV